MASPLADLPMMSVGRTRDFWNMFLFGSLAVAVIVALPQVTPFIWPEFRPALFLTTWMLAAAMFAGIYGTAKLDDAIAAFQPDRVIKHSFLRSLHEVPREFQSISTRA